MTNKIETLPHDFNSKEVQNPLEFTFYGGVKANLISFELRNVTADYSGNDIYKYLEELYLEDYRNAQSEEYPVCVFWLPPRMSKILKTHRNLDSYNGVGRYSVLFKNDNGFMAIIWYGAIDLFLPLEGIIWDKTTDVTFGECTPISPKYLRPDVPSFKTEI